MKTQILVIGVVIFAFSIIGYMAAPSLMSKMMDSFTAPMAGSGNSPVNGMNMLRQMGFPPIETINNTMQYSFLGLAFVGIGLVVFGMIAKKKIPKKISATTNTETATIIEKPVTTIKKPQDREIKENLKTIRLLQERLAKGEITTKEFLDLKKFLE